jgi:uncharacterized protein (TIGR03435 family)
MLSRRTLIALLSVIAAAQTTQSRLEFEVASIRPIAPAEAQVNIGMHIDGALVRFNYLSVLACMRIAWKMKPYQFIAPEWMNSDRFNITAKLPPGTNQDQVPEMLQNLLQDRFKMTIHREQRDFPVYALTVGKSGLKIKQTEPDSAPSGAPTSSLDIKATAGTAGVYADLGNGAYFTFADNHLIGHKLSMARIADLLTNFMDKPVLDMTGLSTATSYDLSLAITADDYRTMQIRAALKSGIALPPEAAQMADLATDSLSSALEAAGLRLDPRKAPQDVIVIDRADKTPTEN